MQLGTFTRSWRWQPAPPGVELGYRFIGFTGHAVCGCCDECWEQAKPLMGAALAEVEAAIPEAFTGYPPRFERYDNAQCTRCGWTGHEGQMKGRRTLMGDGTYPGGAQPATPLFTLTPRAEVAL